MSFKSSGTSTRGASWPLTEAGPRRTRWAWGPGRNTEPSTRGSNWNSWLTWLQHLLVTKVLSFINQDWPRLYLCCITSLLNILTAVSDRVRVVIRIIFTILSVSSAAMATLTSAKRAWSSTNPLMLKPMAYMRPTSIFCLSLASPRESDNRKLRTDFRSDNTLLGLHSPLVSITDTGWYSNLWEGGW